MATCVLQMLVEMNGDPGWWHDVKKKSVWSNPLKSMDRAPLQPFHNWVPRWQVEQPQPDIMEAVLQGVFIGKVRASVCRRPCARTLREYAGRLHFGIHAAKPRMLSHHQNSSSLQVRSSRVSQVPAGETMSAEWSLI